MKKSLISANSPPLQNESGIALILVTLIIALASIIVVNLTYTANLDARANLVAEKSLQAEYLLKSAVSFAQALIKVDTSPSEDGQQDLWAKFMNGTDIPVEMLGIAEPGLRVQVEIRPEDSKMPLRELLRDKRWRAKLARLFRELGFDEDGELDHTGLMPGKFLDSNQMVAALIDYIDPDTDSFQDSDPEFQATGIEASLPDGTFPNRGTISRVGELGSIPGFSPNRVRKLTPFVRTRGGHAININLAPEIVLRALDDDMTPADTAAIIAFREGPDGPFGQVATLTQELNPLIQPDLVDSISWTLTADSRYFQVLAKVESGASTYFARAYIAQRGDGQLPAVKSFELF